jgi:hypothetical protein
VLYALVPISCSDSLINIDKTFCEESYRKYTLCMICCDSYKTERGFFVLERALKKRHKLLLEV